MKNKIYKYNNSLTEISSSEIYVSNVSSIIVSQTSDGTFSNSTSLPFTISISNGQVPYINEEEIMTVLREKIDLSAHGKNYIQIKNNNIDASEDKKPYRPLEMPEGFIELRGVNNE